MSFRSRLTMALFVSTGALAACDDAELPTEASAGPQLNVRQVVGEDNLGPPFYSLIQPGWFPMTDEWAAVPWLRETHCVPGGFNILGFVDLTILFPPAVPFPAPRPLFCPLTVTGHEIWNTDPPDPAVGPLNITVRGLGAVPIWFVATAELLPALADGVLTIDELAAMSSLRIGHATHFTLAQQTGTARGQPGAGKINITARGTLEGGGTFFFQTAEGPPYSTPIAHTRIDIR
ncbi:MAG TPA: hypothetical protein VK933_13180 [Longimicrobiales bacterium]|nr:hypothetical protein [Longimicrobiales bacterium]